MKENALANSNPAGNGDINVNGKPEKISLSNSQHNDTTVKVETIDLQQSLTFISTFAILVSNIGGISVFIAPTTILKDAGSPGLTLLIWIVGGFFQAGIAACTLEMVLIFKNAGGPYFYIYKTFGDLTAFTFVWGFVIFVSGPLLALTGYTTSLYLLALVYDSCAPPDGLVKLFAMWILLSVTALNCTHMKLVTKIQAFLSCGKLLALLTIIVIGFIHIATESGHENLNHFMDETTTDGGKLGLAFLSAYFAFGGWQVITFLAEEVKTPNKTIPRAMGGSFFVLIAAFVCTNLGYFVVLSKREALKSDAIAILFAEAVHPSLTYVLAILISMTSISNMNVIIMGQPRILFAAGRNGHMPRIMTLLHEDYLSPWPATIVMGLLGAGMILSGTVSSLVQYLSLYIGIMTLILMICCIYLKKAKPDLPRPFKVHIFFPILFVILSLSLLVLSLVEKPDQFGLVLLIAAAGVPIYIVCISCKTTAKLFNFMDVIGYYLQVSLRLKYAKKE